MLWTNRAYESTFFQIYECSNEGSPNSSCQFCTRTQGQGLFKFCITVQCHKIQLFCNFLAQTLYTLVKRNPLKCKFLNFPHVDYKTTNQLLFRFCIICIIWKKIWRKTDMWFGKWHKDFGKLSPEHSKASKLGSFYPK